MADQETGPGKVVWEVGKKPPANPNRPPTFTDPARYFRGALVSIGDDNKKTTIPFQYNPAELKRSLKPAQYKDEKGESKLFKGAGQDISLQVRLQAVDAMVSHTKAGKKELAGRGLYARLAALELLLYPPLDKINKYRDEAKSKSNVVPPNSNPTLFIWGPQRVLPVRLTSMSVNETRFNILLSPIEATVDLAMEVADTLSADDDAWSYLDTYLKNLETMRDDQKDEVLGSEKATGATY